MTFLPEHGAIWKTGTCTKRRRRDGGRRRTWRRRWRRAQGWSYDNHEQFLQVVNRSASLQQRRLRPWRKSATDLHSFFYWRKEAMDAEDILENLRDVEALIGALEGLLG